MTLKILPVSTMIERFPCVELPLSPRSDLSLVFARLTSGLFI